MREKCETLNCNNRVCILYIPNIHTNIYNKKNKGPTVMELLMATGKLKKNFFFDN
jgi:hypothetical protein